MCPNLFASEQRVCVQDSTVKVCNLLNDLFIIFNEMKIYLFFDLVHLIKNIRNIQVTEQSAPVAIFEQSTCAAIQKYFTEKKDAVEFLHLINVWWTISSAKLKSN